MDVPQDPLEVDVLAAALAAPFWAATEPDDAMRGLIGDAADSPALLAALARLGPAPLAALAGAPGDGARARAAFFVAGPDDLEQVRVEGEDRCLTAFLRGGRVAAVQFDDPDPGDEPLALDAAAARLRGALDATPSVDQDTAVTLPLLEHLLTGAAGAWPRPALVAEEVFGEADVDLLVAAFASWLGGDPAYADDAKVIAASMLGFQLDRGVAEPVQWTAADVREYLTDYLPWVTGTTGVGAAVARRAAGDFLRYLQHEGLVDATAVAAAAPAARPAGGGGDPRRRRDKRRAAKAARRRNRG